MYYHGTSKSNGTAILTTQTMHASIGDNHWLGNGCYFFRDAFYAFRWIAIDYTNNFLGNWTDKINELYKHHMILVASIDLTKERTYSLSDPLMHINFMNLLDLLREKQEHSERFKNVDIQDGVVLNILFEDMDYKNDFDAVEGSFPIRTARKTDSRFNSFNEYQICIKNASIIKSIHQFSSDTVQKEYIDTMEQYNIIKFGDTSINKGIKKNIYSKNNKNKYKIK